MEERGHSVALTICHARMGRGKRINGVSLGGGVIGKGEFWFKRADSATKTSVE